MPLNNLRAIYIMADYKIIKDEELKILVAVPSAGAREAVTGSYGIKGNNPTTRSTTTSEVRISESDQQAKTLVIDVVSNYDWKVSPNSNIVEHPYIILQEYRINKSPLLAQLSYTVKTGVEGLGAVSKAIMGSPSDKRSFIEGLLKDLGESISSAEEKIQEVISSTEVDRMEAVEENLEGALKPFQGLYYLKKTNFKYKLPYFSKKMTERTGNWQAGYPGGSSSSVTDLIEGGLDFVARVGAGVPLLGAYAEPGLYIERGKYFQPTTGQDNIVVKFPLLNTLNPESIQKNFNLIWLLCFQNSSFRRNKTDVFPPCIYRVLIPGIRFMLYASISNITIEYVGTRRRMPVVHPATGETIDTAIPEAYNVELTITSLTTECGNFLLKSLTNDIS